MLENSRPLKAERQLNFEMCLQLVPAIVRARTIIEMGPRGHLNDRGKVETVVLGLRQRVREAALDTAAQSFSEIDEQPLVTNEPEVRAEGVARDRWVPAERALTEDVGRARNAGIAIDG